MMTRAPPTTAAGGAHLATSGRARSASTGWTARRRSLIIADPSCPRAYPLTEQARRAEHQHEDQDDKGPHVLVSRPQRKVLRRHHLDDAKHEPAQHRAGDVADAAQHRRGEGLEAGDETHAEVDLDE